MARSPGTNRDTAARIASGFFFPQRITLRIDGHQFSASVLDKIVDAGARCSSFKDASGMLLKQAGVKISAMGVARITGQVGEELKEAQESQAQLHKRGELKAATDQPVDIGCVQVDGGRIHTRASDQGRGVHEPGWKESKTAAVWRMTGPTFESDPHPEPPRCFLDEEHVAGLVRGLKQRNSAEKEAESTLWAATAETARDESASEREWPPKRLFRTCVATLKDVYAFGPLVAAEAQRRGFYAASRKVFLGDGDQKNWIVHKLHFRDFVAVTDFIHPVAYLYEAADAVTNSPAARWEQYTQWMTDCWKGRVAKVLEDLQDWQGRLTAPDIPAGDNTADALAVLKTTITYLEHNQPRMSYPDYRRQGLPITSCLVESLIKQVNQRVKASDRFWNRPEGAEAILQVRSAFLSEGEPLTKHIQSRPGCAFHRHADPAHASHAK